MVDQKHQEFLKAYKNCHEPFLRYCSALAYGKMDVEDLAKIEYHPIVLEIKDPNLFGKYFNIDIKIYEKL